MHVVLLTMVYNMHSILALCFNMCLSAAGFILYKLVCWKLFSCTKI